MLTQKIKNHKDVASATQALESKIREQEKEMLFQLKEMREALKPKNVFENTFSYMVKTPEIKKTIIGSALGFVMGYLVKKSAQVFSEENINATIENFAQYQLNKIEEKNPKGLCAKAIFFIRKFTPKDSPIYPFVKYRDVEKC